MLKNCFKQAQRTLGTKSRRPASRPPLLFFPSSVSSQAGLQSAARPRFFCGLPPSSRLVFEVIDEQLSDLKDEIDAITDEIRVEKARRQGTTDVGEKAIVLKSIDVLNEALKGLRATREKLIDASLIPAPVPAPVKNTFLSLSLSLCWVCVCVVLCAVDALFVRVRD